MQLNDAVQIVQQKFTAEAQGKTDGPELEAYQNAYDQFPALMEIATHCVAEQIIQANYHAQRQAATQQQAQAEGAAAPAPAAADA